MIQIFFAFLKVSSKKGNTKFVKMIMKHVSTPIYQITNVRIREFNYSTASLLLIQILLLTLIRQRFYKKIYI